MPGYRPSTNSRGNIGWITGALLLVSLTCFVRHTGPGRPRYEFYLVPRNGWHSHVQKLRCSASNNLDWNGDGELPQAPGPGCWLLPVTDEMAICIARLKEQLQDAGWKLLSSKEEVVRRLSNKAALEQYARQLRLLDYLPKHYASPKKATYPCILKATTGCYGRNIHIVHSEQDVLALTSNLSSQWLLQELIPGHFEYSMSLLVVNGEIVDAICMRYEYAKEVYVWPYVETVHQELIDASPEHLDVMRRFLRGYSGICNFNYKIRPDGQICVFEVNTRIGADLACDIPRERGSALFKKLAELDLQPLQA